LLENRKIQILKNIQSTAKEFEELSSSEVNDDVDIASITMDQEIEQLSTRQQQVELEEINCALAKLSMKKYGWCEICSDLISIHRLKALPYAKLCIKCQEETEKKRKNRKD
jgi:DnaK suppressor protein